VPDRGTTLVAVDRGPLQASSSGDITGVLSTKPSTRTPWPPRVAGRPCHDTGLRSAGERMSQWCA